MTAKTWVWVGLFVGSTIGSWVGALAAHGNWLSWQSVLAGMVGAFFGIWAGFKLSRYL